jgi:hypothetical protein
VTFPKWRPMQPARYRQHVLNQHPPLRLGAHAPDHELIPEFRGIRFSDHAVGCTEWPVMAHRVENRTTLRTRRRVGRMRGGIEAARHCPAAPRFVRPPIRPDSPRRVTCLTRPLFVQPFSCRELRDRVLRPQLAGKARLPPLRRGGGLVPEAPLPSHHRARLPASYSRFRR